MKKQTLYNIYSKLVNNTEDITNILYKMIELNGDSEKIFYDFCTNYPNLISGETIQHFIKLSSSIPLIYDESMKEELINLIYKLLDNDYITSCEDFILIIQNLICILNLNVEDAFDYDYIEELDYYRVYLVEQFINILDESKNYNMDDLYKHDYGTIIDNYFNMLEDINNTKEESYGEEDSRLKRIKLFSEIISNKRIYMMDDEKYNIILRYASEIRDIKELTKLKHIVLLSGSITDEEFFKRVNSCTDDVTSCMVDMIYNKLKIESSYNKNNNIINIHRKNKNKKTELELIKKLINPE